jgi:hypothetical protein
VLLVVVGYVVSDAGCFFFSWMLLWFQEGSSWLLCRHAFIDGHEQQVLTPTPAAGKPSRWCRMSSDFMQACHGGYAGMVLVLPAFDSAVIPSHQ